MFQKMSRAAGAVLIALATTFLTPTTGKADYYQSVYQGYQRPYVGGYQGGPWIRGPHGGFYSPYYGAMYRPYYYNDGYQTYYAYPGGTYNSIPFVFGFYR